jgi:hypothetical protein
MSPLLLASQMRLYLVKLLHIRKTVCCGAILFLHHRIHFLAEDLYIAGRRNAQADLTPGDRDNGHDHVITNGYTFSWAATENEHGNYRK